MRAPVKTDRLQSRGPDPNSQTTFLYITVFWKRPFLSHTHRPAQTSQIAQCDPSQNCLSQPKSHNSTPLMGFETQPVPSVPTGWLPALPRQAGLRLLHSTQMPLQWRSAVPQATADYAVAVWKQDRRSERSRSPGGPERSGGAGECQLDGRARVASHRRWHKATKGVPEGDASSRRKCPALRDAP